MMNTLGRSSENGGGIGVFPLQVVCHKARLSAYDNSAQFYHRLYDNGRSKKDMQALMRLTNLVDPRFADDSPLFAHSASKWQKCEIIRDSNGKGVFAIECRQHDETVILTNRAQPPNTFVTRDGVIFENFGSEARAKAMMQHIDLAYHMEPGTNAFARRVIERASERACK